MINIIWGKRKNKYAEFVSPLFPSRYIAQADSDGCWYVYEVRDDDVITLAYSFDEGEAVRIALEYATQALVDAGVLEVAL
jgi:hypothetical protein